jgi:hypothetical protein
MARELNEMVRDFGTDLLSSLIAARKEAESGDAYAVGHKAGLYEALSMLLNRARAFGVPLSSLNLEGIGPDRFI